VDAEGGAVVYFLGVTLMEIRGPGDVSKTTRIEPAKSGAGVERPDTTLGSREDTVEFSQISTLLSKLSSTPEVRQDRIEEIRGQIERGEYLTDEKLNVAMNRLLDLLS
jgi:anti-sigma28 factor (negative regulator of flagellin synthesis)